MSYELLFVITLDQACVRPEEKTIYGEFRVI